MVNDEAELHDPRVDQRAQESHRRLVDILEKLEDYHLLQEMRRLEFDNLVSNFNILLIDSIFFLKYISFRLNTPLGIMVISYSIFLYC